MPTSFRDVQVRETHPQSQMSTGTKQQGVTDNSFEANDSPPDASQPGRLRPFCGRSLAGIARAPLYDIMISVYYFRIPGGYYSLQISPRIITTHGNDESYYSRIRDSAGSQH